MTDPIADFLTRIRNAQMARRRVVRLPFSKLKFAIAEVMVKNGFLAKAEKDLSGKFPVLSVELGDRNVQLSRVSKPGQRIYIKAEDIRKVLNGFGISIISTSLGVMTGYEARSKKVGGEFLCKVY